MSSWIYILHILLYWWWLLTRRQLQGKVITLLMMNMRKCSLGVREDEMRMKGAVAVASETICRRRSKFRSGRPEIEFSRPHALPVTRWCLWNKICNSIRNAFVWISQSNQSFKKKLHVPLIFNISWSSTVLPVTNQISVDWPLL